jgi:AcrR family transcriptional regulator
MLIAASWPSNSDAAVTKRKGDARRTVWRASLAAVVIDRIPCFPGNYQFAKILIQIKIEQICANLKCSVGGFRRKRGGTMAGNPEETRFQLQRDRMLRAAAECFNRKGYSGTSLKDVADILGLTDAALYYYVRNKEELVYLCYVRAAHLARDAMQRAVAEGGSGLERVRLYIRNHIELIVGESGPLAIMSEIPSLTRTHRDEILATSREHSKNFEAILESGIKDGSIAPCDVRMTGNAIMGAINWIPKWFHGDDRAARRVLEEFPVILSSGLESRPD